MPICSGEYILSAAAEFSSIREPFILSHVLLKLIKLDLDRRLALISETFYLKLFVRHLVAIRLSHDYLGKTVPYVRSVKFMQHIGWFSLETFCKYLVFPNVYLREFEILHWNYVLPCVQRMANHSLNVSHIEPKTSCYKKQQSGIVDINQCSYKLVKISKHSGDASQITWAEKEIMAGDTG